MPDVSNSGVTEVFLDDNQITSIPDGFLENAANLQYLDLHNNQITSIPSGGLSSLPILDELRLDGNRISVVPQTALNGLPSLRILLLNDNLLSSIPMFNLGVPNQQLQVLMLHGNRIGSFEGLAASVGDALSAFPTLMPNAADCAVAETDSSTCLPSDSEYMSYMYYGGSEQAGLCNYTLALETLQCTGCSLGYTDNGLYDAGCVLPRFNTSAEWSSVSHDFGRELQGRLTLSEPYSTGALALSPKQDKFVGYANGEFAAIRFELEFGAGRVDIGCGDTVVGDTSVGETATRSRKIRNTEYRPDNSRYGPEFLYDSPEHHYRFRVEPTSPGDTTLVNLTFDSCLSKFPTALTVYRDGGGGDGAGSLVEVYPTEDRRILPGIFANAFATALPHERGCGVLNLAAKATVPLQPGNYVVAIEAGLSWDYDSPYVETLARQGQYVLTMTCGPGATTLRSDDGSPGGFSVNPETGAVSGAPQHTGNFSMSLVAVDSAGARATVKSWGFEVIQPESFAVSEEWRTNQAKGSAAMAAATNVLAEYTAGQAYTIAAPKLPKQSMFVNPKNDDYDAISYKLAYDPANRSPGNMLVDTSTGKMLFSVNASDKLGSGEHYTVLLTAVDGGGAEKTVKRWSFNVTDPAQFKTTPKWGDPPGEQQMTSGIQAKYSAGCTRG